MTLLMLIRDAATVEWARTRHRSTFQSGLKFVDRMYQILNYFTSNTENSVPVFHGSTSSHVSLRLGASAALNLDTYSFQSALLKARYVHCGQKERAVCVSPLHFQPLPFPIRDNRVHKHIVQNVCCKANTRLYEQLKTKSQPVSIYHMFKTLPASKCVLWCWCWG